jgi:hypothetical protein
LNGLFLAAAFRMLAPRTADQHVLQALPELLIASMNLACLLVVLAFIFLIWQCLCANRAALSAGNGSGWFSGTRPSILDDVSSPC